MGQCFTPRLHSTKTQPCRRDSSQQTLEIGTIISVIELGGGCSLAHFMLHQERPCMVLELEVGCSISFSLHEVEDDFGGATSEEQAL